jgi:hypothetical protein
LPWFFLLLFCIKAKKKRTAALACNINKGGFLLFLLSVVEQSSRNREKAFLQGRKKKWDSLNFSFFLFLDEKKQKSRAAEKKAKNLSSRVKWNSHNSCIKPNNVRLTGQEYSQTAVTSFHFYHLPLNFINDIFIVIFVLMNLLRRFLNAIFSEAHPSNLFAQ